MTNNYKPGDNLRNVIKVFSLAIAALADMKSPEAVGVPWFAAEANKIFEEPTLEGRIEEMVQITIGFVNLTLILIDGLANALECSHDAAIEKCRRMIEQTFPYDL